MQTVCSRRLRWNSGTSSSSAGSWTRPSGRSRNSSAARRRSWWTVRTRSPILTPRSDCHAGSTKPHMDLLACPQSLNWPKQSSAEDASQGPISGGRARGARPRSAPHVAITPVIVFSGALLGPVPSGPDRDRDRFAPRPGCARRTTGSVRLAVRQASCRSLVEQSSSDAPDHQTSGRQPADAYRLKTHHLADRLRTPCGFMAAGSVGSRSSGRIRCRTRSSFRRQRPRTCGRRSQSCLPTTTQAVAARSRDRWSLGQRLRRLGR